MVVRIESVFGSLGNLASLVKRAQELGGQLEGISSQLRERRAVGTAGGGLVEVEVNGVQEVVRCKIDPALFAQNDAEFVEDLLVAATNQALVKAREFHADAMRSLTEGMDMPGLKEALSKLQGS
jgi:DNA-binding YbaB/EbfC family protein